MRVHRISQTNTSNAAEPRTVIMVFPTYRDRVCVIRGARAKGQILYKNQPVRFTEELATGIHKKQTEFDIVGQQLGSVGIGHGTIPPARLLNKTGKAEELIKKLKMDRSDVRVLQLEIY